MCAANAQVRCSLNQLLAVQVLRDISTPDDGLYSVRDPMETRLSYVRWQMDNILSDPAIKLSILGKGERSPCLLARLLAGKTVARCARCGAVAGCCTAVLVCSSRSWQRLDAASPSALLRPGASVDPLTTGAATHSRQPVVRMHFE